MIREIAWYFEDARFTNMAETLEKSVSAYAEALASGAAENDIRARREEARSLFEAECAASGLKAEGYAAGGSFINIDAEFFTSGNLDREALNACIKNIIKGHCYEKTLWLYMGTTGTFTALSKAAMRREGRAWEDLFPRAYRKKYPRKNPLEKKCGGDVVLYAWNDGTFSRNYLPEKARWRFDALRDKSGFDWKDGYDPNAEVAKKGWRGGFDDEGVWRRCDSSGEGGSERPVESPPLFLINRGGFAMLYDPQGFLFSQEEIFYFTEDGGLYGKLSPDMEKTARKIRAALTGMGLTSIGEAAGPSGCEEEAVNRACRALFKEIVSPGLVVRSAEEANAAINEKIREAQNREASSAGVRLERTIRFLRQAGASSGGLEEALLTGVFRLPLEPRTREGCILLGLNAEEARCAMSHPVPPGRESEFYSALSNIFAAWDVYKNCGLAKQEMISRVYEALCEKTVDGEKSAAEKTLAAETSLEGLFGMDNSFAAPLGFLHSSGIPGIFGEREIVNFYVREAAASYIRKLEKKKTLPRGAGDEVFSVLSEQPAFTKEKEDVLNRALTRALSQYPAVHLSTGMSVASLTRAACSAVEGKEGAFLEKRVFWELPLHSFVRNAGRKNFQMRQVSITAAGGDGEKNEMRPLIVVGAARGESLAEKGFGYKVLREKYGMTEDAAHKTEKFLRTVRMDEEISREEASLFMADADRCLAEFGKSGAGAFRAAFLKLIDSREDAAYNLTAEDGFGAYLKSGRFKASRLKAESIAEFVSGEKAVLSSTPPHNQLCTLRPAYREEGSVRLFSKTAPMGKPELVIARKASKGFYPAPEAAKTSGRKTGAPAASGEGAYNAFRLNSAFSAPLPEESAQTETVLIQTPRIEPLSPVSAFRESPGPEWNAEPFPQKNEALNRIAHGEKGFPKSGNRHIFNDPSAGPKHGKNLLYAEARRPPPSASGKNREPTGELFPPEQDRDTVIKAARKMAQDFQQELVRRARL